MSSFPEIGSPSEGFDGLKKRLFITVEPLIFASYFLLGLTDAVMTNVIISRTCTIIYGLPFEQCSGQLEPSIESLVQSYAAQIAMLKSVLGAIICGIVVMFVGTWSDANGRKPFIVIPSAGSVLFFICWFMFMYLPTWPPMWILLPTVIVSMTGGLSSIFICVFSLITDITRQDNRAFRMSIVFGMITLGVVCGYGSSNLIYKYFAYTHATSIIFGVAAIVSFLNLMYAVFCLPETKVPEEDVSCCFFNFSNVKETLRTVFKSRPNNLRIILLMEGFTLVIASVIFNGEMSYKYLALRKSFNWDLSQYNMYAATLSTVSAVSMSLGSYISSSVLHVHDMYIAFFVALMAAFASLLLALARTSLEFYLFSIVDCFGLLIQPMLRAQISKSVHINEIGKYYAVITMFETLFPIITSPLYRFVYNTVLETEPLEIFYLSMSLWLNAAFLVFAALLIQSFLSRNYDELVINNEIAPSTSGVLS